MNCHKTTGTHLRALAAIAGMLLVGFIGPGTLSAQPPAGYVYRPGHGPAQPAHTDSQTVRPDRWVIWLFRRGVYPALDGSDAWGQVSGPSAVNVRSKLLANQQLERRRTFVSPTDSADFTYFNFLGPVAIVYDDTNAARFDAMEGASLAWGRVRDLTSAMVHVEGGVDHGARDRGEWVTRMSAIAEDLAHTDRAIDFGQAGDCARNWSIADAADRIESIEAQLAELALSGDSGSVEVSAQLDAGRGESARASTPLANNHKEHLQPFIKRCGALRR